MEHRNLPGQAQLPELERTWNHQPSDPRINLGTGASTVHADNTVVCSLNSVQSFNNSGRIGALHAPNYRPEVPNHMSNNDPYVHPFAGISARFPLEYMHHGPYYNQIGAKDGSMAVNPQIDYQRATNKRKFQAISDVSTSTNYYVGSSSSFPSSVEHTHTKPMLGPHYSNWDPNYFVPSHMSNNVLTPEEGSQGTVRRQYGSDIHLRTSSAMHPSNNAHHNFHSGANTLGPAGQWCHNPLPSITHSALTSSVAGSGIFNHEIGHLHGATYVSSGSMDIAEEQNSGFIPHRNSMPSQFLTGPSTRSVISGHGNFNQGTGYSINMSHPPMGVAVNLEDARTPGIDSMVPPRFLRPPMEVVPHRNERIGRVRSHYGRLPAFTHEDNARARWVSEGVSMMDQLPYVDSSNLYDQHREMRLDIDNMSYEELLALGERIGSVSTGLSEDAASKCLRLTTYCPNHAPDEAELNCAICLEVYREQEQVGRLNCNHDFHASCITKWLLIKNACPICKASASTEQ